MSVDVSVIVVSFSTRDLTLACLRSVVEQTKRLNYELIVIDNGSTDNSAAAIASEVPSAKLAALDKNIGFAAANNLAARSATGEFVLLLNPDTVVLDAAIERAVAFARARSEVGIVGGRTFFADMSLNHTSCHARPTPWSVLCMGLGMNSLFRRSRLFDPESLGRWERDTPRQVDAVTGCFCLIRRELWNDLGGFDESFFMYGEDTDLCIRAVQRGSVCMICPEARVVHHGGKSERVRSEKLIRLFRAKAQLFQKHWTRREASFGVAMLRLCAFSRMCALRLLSVIRPRLGESYLAWKEVWRRRGEFA